jgi:flagellin FlaB
MFKRLYKEESGITALETAIILIAFVVVAAVFAFTILSAGTFSTEKGKEAIYAGLEEVSGSMELKGSIMGISNTVGISGTGQVNYLSFTVGNVAGGSPIDLTPSSGDNKVVIDYHDKDQYRAGMTWDIEWPVRHDVDNLLEDGELAKITVTLTGTVSPSLSTDTSFALEVKPPRGAVLSFEKTTPSYIDSVVVFDQ